MPEPTPEIIAAVDELPRVMEEPPYRVMIHNDDITPMVFVLHVLQLIFLLAGPRAAQVMFTAHIHGVADVDSLPKSEAQRRIHRAHFAARMSGYPLLFTLEMG